MSDTKGRGRPRGGSAARDARRRAGRRAGSARDGGGSVAGFVIRLLAGWALAIGVLALVPQIERWAVMATVASVTGTLRLVSLDPTISGSTISLGTLALRIIPECTPLMPGVLLATAMAAYPLPVRWKLAGIAVGNVALWLFNIVRMLALMGTLAWWPGTFRFMHVYLWQTISLLAVSALFLAWLRLAPTPRTTA